MFKNSFVNHSSWNDISFYLLFYTLVLVINLYISIKYTTDFEELRIIIQPLWRYFVFIDSSLSGVYEERATNLQ